MTWVSKHSSQARIGHARESTEREQEQEQETTNPFDMQTQRWQKHFASIARSRGSHLQPSGIELPNTISDCTRGMPTHDAGERGGACITRHETPQAIAMPISCGGNGICRSNSSRRRVFRCASARGGVEIQRHAAGIARRSNDIASNSRLATHHAPAAANESCVAVVPSRSHPPRWALAPPRRPVRSRAPSSDRIRHEDDEEGGLA